MPVAYTTPVVYNKYTFARADITPEQVEALQTRFWNSNRRYVEQRAYMRHGADNYVMICKTETAWRNDEGLHSSVEIRVVHNRMF